MSEKKEQTQGKTQFYILSLVIVSLLLGIFSMQAFGNKEQLATTPTEAAVPATSVTESATSALDKLSIWDIILMCDWFLWPFILVAFAGVFIITYYSLREYQDKSRARILLRGQIKPNNVKSLGRILQTCKSNRAARLLDQMLNTYSKTNRAESINEDVSKFATNERAGFETFNRITGFLSETSGALGLLGTVWGIFITFYSAKMDGPTILKGMSISLITTLVGLIISLVINSGATYIFALFNKQMKLITDKAEELRQALLFLEKRTPKTPVVVSEKSAPSNGQRKVRVNAERASHNREATDVIY